MTAMMVHRGPDGIAHWTGGSAALGHCMLRTTPESLEEVQPLANDAGTCILVMDGRVDNWLDLRTQLIAGGAALRNQSDAELVLHAYEMWGADCPRHIDGDFAFVLWDMASQSIFCARDRFGIKPLQYHWDGTHFSFASEVSALLALPWVKAELNEGLVLEYLGAQWRTIDESFWHGIRRLTPSTGLMVDRQGPRRLIYWKPPLDNDTAQWSDAAYAAKYLELFTDAVRRLSRSNSPVAYEVSGGLDSSAIFSVAERLRRAGQLPAPDVCGYTLKFPAGTEADELHFVKAVAAHSAKEVAEIAPSCPSIAWYQAQVQADAEMPDYPNGAMANGLRTIARSRGSRALLAGVGADELLSSGRNYYADAISAMDWRKFLHLAVTDVRSCGVTQTVKWILRFGVFECLPASVQGMVRSILRHVRPEHSRRVAGWLTPRSSQLLRNRVPKPFSSNFEPRTPEQSKLLNSLFDPYSLWSRSGEELSCAKLGLDLRYPFLDRALVEFLLTMPSHMRMRGEWTKFVHRQAMKGVLPEEVRWRPDKANFMTIFHSYFPALIGVIEGLNENNEANQWVEWDAVTRESGRIGSTESGGWPEVMLWTLFGGLALASSENDREDHKPAQLPDEL